MSNFSTNGFGSVAGSAGSPDTLWDSATDGPACNAFRVKNPDASLWLNVKVTTMKGIIIAPLLPGDQELFVVTGADGNGITKVQGWATTANNAGAGTLTAVGYPVKVL